MKHFKYTGRLCIFSLHPSSFTGVIDRIVYRVGMFMHLVNYGIVDHLKSFVDTFYDFVVDCGVFMNTAT